MSYNPKSQEMDVEWAGLEMLLLWLHHGEGKGKNTILNFFLLFYFIKQHNDIYITKKRPLPLILLRDRNIECHDSHKVYAGCGICRVN